MKRIWVIWLLILVVWLPGCRRAEDIPQDGPSLSIAIDFPEVFYTKTSPELSPAALETEIHSLRVWIFRDDDKTNVGFLDLPTDENPLPSGGGVKRYIVKNIGWGFVNDHPKVSVFALANAESIGLPDVANGIPLDGSISYDDLLALSFGYVPNPDDPDHPKADFFGLSNPVHEVPSEGLPMSAFRSGMDMYGISPQLKVESVKLQRMVSRVRMVCCKTKTVVDPNATETVIETVHLDNFTLYKEQIPLKEHVFAEEQANGTACSPVLDAAFSNKTDNYWSLPFIVNGPDVLAENDAPENLIYTNQAPNDYQAALDAAAQADPLQLNDLGYTYLRESDLRLLGMVNYTVTTINTTDNQIVSSKSRYREFAMSSAGDFARNHSWTLFAYFMSGRNVQLSLTALPWDRSDYEVHFSSESVTVTSKFTVDPTTADISYSSSEKIYEVKLIPGSAAKGHLHITTPEGGTLMIYPQGGASLFSVYPETASIKPSRNSGRIDIEIRAKQNTGIDIDQLPETETRMTLSFYVISGTREIDINSEAVDNVYRFHL